MKTIGIIAALPQEIAELLEKMGSQMTQQTIGMRTFYIGEIQGKKCVIVLARIGKVAASATCTTLIQTFGVTEIIFTGLAGAVSQAVNIGDIVIGTEFCQHDMNAEPLFPRYEIPLLDKAFFTADTALNSDLAQACEDFVQSRGAYGLQTMVSEQAIADFSLQELRIHHGLILSGDQFVNSNEAVADLQQRFPEALCTEMEGAAIAQICYEYDVPFAVVRVISDKANHSASHDFGRFLKEVAPFISSGVLLTMLLVPPAGLEPATKGL